MNYADYYSPPAYHPPKSQLGMQMGMRPGFNPYSQQQAGSAIPMFGEPQYGAMQMAAMHNSTGLQAPQYQPPMQSKYGSGSMSGADRSGARPLQDPRKRWLPWWVKQAPPEQQFQMGFGGSQQGSGQFNPYAQMRLY